MKSDTEWKDPDQDQYAVLREHGTEWADEPAHTQYAAGTHYWRARSAAVLLETNTIRHGLAELLAPPTAVGTSTD
jgi:hypothetical protein